MRRELPTTDLLPPPPDDTFRSSIAAIDPATRNRMGETWQEGCPVPIEDLRRVTVSHWGFDGELHTGELVLHRDVAEDVVGVFARLHEIRFPIESLRLTTTADLDAAPTGDGNGSGSFTCRVVRGGTSLSQHSFGTAVDINPFQNPFQRGDLVLPELASAYLDRSDVRPGMILPGDEVVAAFAAIGWQWGGTWAEPDHMHFSRDGGLAAKWRRGSRSCCRRRRARRSAATTRRGRRARPACRPSTRPGPRSRPSAGLRLGDEPTMPAIERYTGVLYRELDWPSLPPAAKRRGRASLLVFSGLWGAVSPHDPIPYYKLKMSASLDGLGPPLDLVAAPARRGPRPGAAEPHGVGPAPAGARRGLDALGVTVPAAHRGALRRPARRHGLALEQAAQGCAGAPPAGRADRRPPGPGRLGPPGRLPPRRGRLRARR